MDQVRTQQLVAAMDCKRGKLPNGTTSILPRKDVKDSSKVHGPTAKRILSDDWLGNGCDQQGWPEWKHRSLAPRW